LHPFRLIALHRLLQRVSFLFLGGVEPLECTRDESESLVPFVQCDHLQSVCVLSEHRVHGEHGSPNVP